MKRDNGAELPPLPHTARPRQRRHFSPPPHRGTHAGIDLHTALERAHETITLLCDELDETLTEQSERDTISLSHFRAIREDRDQWRDKHHLLSVQHARAVQQRDDLEDELGELKQALAVLAGGDE